MKLRVAFEWLYLLFIITVRKTDDSSMWLEAQGFLRTKKRSNEMVITNNTVMNVSEWNKLVGRINNYKAISKGGASMVHYDIKRLHDFSRTKKRSNEMAIKNNIFEWLKS